VRLAALAPASVSEVIAKLREKVRIAIERRFQDEHRVAFGDYQTMAEWCDGILDEAFGELPQPGKKSVVGKPALADDPMAYSKRAQANGGEEGA
jgi:hypothetical protein